MSFVTSFKLAIISIITIYTSYLFFYKCDKINGLDSFLHPLHSHQSGLCQGVNKVETFATPYCKQLQVFLDDNIHNTEFFKKHEIHEKVVFGYEQALKVVDPVATKVFELIECGEVKAYDVASDIYSKGFNLYKDYTK